MFLDISLDETKGRPEGSGKLVAVASDEVRALRNSAVIVQKRASLRPVNDDGNPNCSLS